LVTPKCLKFFASLYMSTLVNIAQNQQNHHYLSTVTTFFCLFSIYPPPPHPPPRPRPAPPLTSKWDPYNVGIFTTPPTHPTPPARVRTPQTHIQISVHTKKHQNFGITPSKIDPMQCPFLFNFIYYFTV
jgi:hypothetical protein